MILAFSLAGLLPRRLSARRPRRLRRPRHHRPAHPPRPPRDEVVGGPLQIDGTTKEREKARRADDAEHRRSRALRDLTAPGCPDKRFAKEDDVATHAKNRPEARSLSYRPRVVRGLGGSRSPGTEEREGAEALREWGRAFGVRVRVARLLTHSGGRRGRRAADPRLGVVGMGEG